MTMFAVVASSPLVHEFAEDQLSQWEPRAACGVCARAPQVVFSTSGERCPACATSHAAAPPTPASATPAGWAPTPLRADVPQSTSALGGPQ